MPPRRVAKVTSATWLGLLLSLELYACAMLALRSFAATPLLPSWPSLVIPPLVVPPIVYVVVGLLGLRPLSRSRRIVAVGAMCMLHAVLILATAALYAGPDFTEYDTALAVALWGSPAVTLLQLMAVLLVSARLHPLLQVRRRAPRVETRVAPLLRHPAEMTLRRPLASERLEAAWADSAKAAARVTASASLPVPPAPQPSPSDAAVEPATPAFGLPPFNASERMIRVPFGRVADQLPVEMFVRAREGLSNTLRPGVSLLIPLRLVVPQLSEGRVRVRWEEIADQFPHEELALPHAEIARRLPHGSLLLPLDEVVPQVPAEILERVSPPADLDDIEDLLPPPAVDAPEAPPRPAPEPSMTAPAPHALTGEARRVAAMLAPLMSGLEVGERRDAGTTLVTVVAPPLREESIVRAALRVRPFLADPRLSAPAAQATLVGREATIVLTPFGSSDVDGALLVAAVASRSSLAWLERLSRSAVGDARTTERSETHSGRNGRTARKPGLHVARVPSPVRELADSLTAFGPVAPTVLRDGEGSLSACLFLPPSVEAVPLAELARDLYAALDGAEIGPVTSVTLRLGEHRIVLRTITGTSVPPTMLVGGGPIDRPGLARIELERAAERLGALAEA
ncbi:MAG: hypothetical protein DMD97_05020 [Candidatus Rokuibacteriota bacterium]|nr:MAG: hypothetical protein DMD97_05020 [Candidatus Rokubacteria bacterium]